MPMADAVATIDVVLEALVMSGRRAVLAAGWGGLGGRTLPDNVHLLDSAPHDQLFPLMSAVVHHGGAGTTAAGLRAGKPTVICPFFRRPALLGPSCGGAGRRSGSGAFQASDARSAECCT